ncbi:MAG: hypothetical protein M3Q07_22875, partial [Pseudobdellovibrionaceae bacterium]|nr:hypothetical protein [Pseudobdellovibrionaceae bacterium]
GNLGSYKIDIGIYNSDDVKIRDLFKPNSQSERLTIPQSFDIEDLTEGSYKVRLSVIDAYLNTSDVAVESQCNLTVRRSCAQDEDFDTASISCVPRLCDNAYRIGAKWNSPLDLQRGEGRYECRLVNNKAQKFLLSHSCKAGYFKSADGCLAAKKLDNTCALLENDQVACWGIMPGREIYPRSDRDFNYQGTFDFKEPIKDFEQNCVRTQSDKVHCWWLVQDSYESGYFLRSGPGTPQSWDKIIPPGYTKFRDAYGINAQGEWFRASADGTGAKRIQIPEKIIDFGGTCAVDQKGKVWCSQGMASQNPTGSESSAVEYDGFSLAQGLPDLAVSTRGYQMTQCALLKNGKVVCWGDNRVGSLGANDPGLRNWSPTYVVNSLGQQLSDIIQIESSLDGNGGTSTCALNKFGQVICWGSNQYGQLGTGTVGEDDEGEFLFSRFAVFVSIELKAPRTP